MSWDDEDFDIPTNQPAAGASWEDDEEEPVLESWDAEEEVKPKKAEPKKAGSAATKKHTATTKKAATMAATNPGLNIDNVDEKTRKEMIRQAELNSDLNNAADLFGGLGVAEDINAHPREKLNQKLAAEKALAPVLTKDTPIDSHPLFQPTNKQEFEKLRKSLAPAITKLSKDSLLNYSSGLAIDLIRDISQPLNVEQVRKAISTLNIILKEKEKAERQARLAKAGGTSTGGAGKKKAKPAARPNVDSGFKKDLDDYDDFADDDFM